MNFLWPQYLWLLLVVPVLVAAYVALLRRKKAAVRYADLGLVKSAMSPTQRFRRHVPPLLFVLAIVAALLAAARPTAVITLPSDARTIILAIDVSLSMRATDVEPNRMVAAQEAAKAFVQELPQDIRAGIVTFAGTALVVQPPTLNREDLVAAIDRFQLQRHTAIGSGLIVSLATLFPEEGIDLESLLFGNGFTSRDSSRRGGLERPENKETKEKKAVQGRASRFLHVGRDHPAHGRPPYDRTRSARCRAHGGRPRRARLHRRLRLRGRQVPSTSTACRSSCVSTRRR